jgi:hypothetical protein
MLHKVSAQLADANFSADSSICNLAIVNSACPRTLISPHEPWQIEVQLLEL